MLGSSSHSVSVATQLTPERAEQQQKISKHIIMAVLLLASISRLVAAQVWPLGCSLLIPDEVIIAELKVEESPVQQHSLYLHLSSFSSKPPLMTTAIFKSSLFTVGCLAA